MLRQGCRDLAIAATSLNSKGKLGNIAARVLHILNWQLFKCDVAIGAEIDKTCMFYHYGLGLVINGHVSIGARSVIMHNVTIGSLYVDGPDGSMEDKQPGYPTIGERCFVGVGAIILGDVSIGDGATVAAGAVVLKDVPPGCVVAGVPARIVKEPNDRGGIPDCTSCNEDKCEARG